MKGGDFYGKLAVQALEEPDDFGRDAHWIPAMSLEQYGATLARWPGIAEADLPCVFPNMGASANNRPGFLSKGLASPYGIAYFEPASNNYLE